MCFQPPGLPVSATKKNDPQPPTIHPSIRMLIIFQFVSYGLFVSKKQN